MCRQFGYSRQAYYKHLKSNNKKIFDIDLILKKVNNIRQIMPRLGGRKLHFLLKESGIVISRDALFDILRDNNMLVKRRKKYAITTNSKHWMKKYPNLIRGFAFEKINRVWVSDITYITTDYDGFVYLSLITDVYSRRIIGYNLYRTLEKEGALHALIMALDTIPEQERIGLIHHSDRGLQYCSKDYVNLLTCNKIRISMTENGDPYENAIAERVNGILKDEWIDREQYINFEQAKYRIDDIIHAYNTLRPHLSCSMLTPIQAYESKKDLKRQWKKRNYLKTT